MRLPCLVVIDSLCQWYCATCGALLSGPTGFMERCPELRAAEAVVTVDKPARGGVSPSGKERP